VVGCVSMHTCMWTMMRPCPL